MNTEEKKEKKEKSMEHPEGFGMAVFSSTKHPDGLTFHCQMTLDFAEKQIQKYPEDFKIEDRWATKKDIPEMLEIIKEMREHGFEVFPACDNIDDKGKCKGHHIKYKDEKK